jgi:AcrR family transcriptional regulator
VVAAATVERSLAARRTVAEAEVGRLVAASLVVIERTGRLEPRVSEIVKEAGLSNQAFYRHFESKHELLVAVLDHGVEMLTGYLAHRMSRVDTPAAKVREWLRGLLAQALDPRGAAATRPFALSRGRLAESYPDEVAASERRLTALLHAPLSDGAASGTPQARDPERDAEALYWLAMGFVQARLASGATPNERDAAHLEAFALSGAGLDASLEAGVRIGGGDADGA